MVSTPNNSRDADFLSTIRRLVTERMDYPNLSIRDFCQAVYLSRSQVYRRLKAATGLSATDYILSMRLERARHLLRSDGLTVSQVAYEVGFRDPAYFSRVFKKQYGQPPVKWRKG